MGSTERYVDGTVASGCEVVGTQVLTKVALPAQFAASGNFSATVTRAEAVAVANKINALLAALKDEAVVTVSS